MEHKRLFYDYSSSDTAFQLFQVLENLRIDAFIARELPGIARLINQFSSQASLLPDKPTSHHAAQKLSQPEATAMLFMDFPATRASNANCRK